MCALQRSQLRALHTPPLRAPASPAQNVHEYEDKEFSNVSKEDLKLADDKGSKKREKALKVGPVGPLGRRGCGA